MCAMRLNPLLALTVAVIAAASDPSAAALRISDGETQNVSCSGGVCTATSKDAALNVQELSGMLASSDTIIKSGSLAKTIEIDAKLSWASTKRLTLDAAYSIAFNNPVVVAGAGGLTIITNDGGHGGDFQFFKKGHVEFGDLHSSLIINGNTYVLESKLSRLARDVHHDGHDNYALARNLNESNREYSESPIGALSGTLEGLGNVISNLKITSNSGHDPLAFIGLLSSSGTRTIRDIGLKNVSVTGAGGARCVGALVGYNSGIIANSYATGVVTATADNSTAGGLACNNQFGDIVRSYSEVAVSVGETATAGGLAGVSDATNFGLRLIDSSYATGPVSGGDGSMLGGLVGNNWGATISNSYSTGAVTGGSNALLGGLVGSNADNPGEQSIPAINTSYSTGIVSGGSGAIIGGLIGQDAADSQVEDTYWDMQTSGISDPHQGAGNIGDDEGITGLTTEQFKSGLPAGFSGSIWAEKTKLNDGYPYLLDNPPPK